MAKYSPEEIKRLDDRMAEMDRLRSDPTMKLVRTKSGKFQYVPKEPELKSLSYKKASISTESPITSLSYKDAAKPKPKLKPKYKPGSSSGPISRYAPSLTSIPTTSSAELMRGFDKKIPSNTPADTASERAKDNTVRHTSGTGNRGGSIPTPKLKEKPYSGDVKTAAKEAYYKALNDSRYERAGKDPDYFALDLFSMPTKNMKKGGKVGKVMGEFKSGSLKSSSGQKVANRKQAMAIAMSEAGKSMKTKKYAAGGKTDKRSFSSGDVFSNYDVGADPFLKSRKGGTFTDKEMKDGLTKDEIMRKTTPKDPLKAKKYAAGGNVNNMAGMRQNPIGQMKQAANLVNTVKSEAAKRGMIPAATRNPRPDMGVMPGYRGPQSPKVAPTTAAPKTSLGVSPIAKSFLTKAGSNPPNVAGTSKPSTPASDNTLQTMIDANKPDMGVLPGYRGPQSPERPIPAKPLDPNLTDTFPRTPSTYSGPQPSATNRALFMKKGGKVGESKKMVKKEVEFFKKKGAPKSMIKHEMGEAKGMKRGGGKMMKFAKGGSIDGCAVRGKTKLKRVKM